MNSSGKIWIVLLIALLPSAAALAADVRSRTTAGILETDGRTAHMQVDAVLLLELQEAPMLSRDDVIVTWRREGGIDPNPFRIAIPAGCFVETRNGLRVDGTSCGVSITLDGTRLATDDFAARLVPPEPIFPPEPIRLRIRLELSQTVPGAAELLATLGGATVIAQIGAERGESPASEIQSKSGISPQPF